MTKPMFVIIEGGECTGKSTQMELLVRAMSNAGIKAIKTHEPGGTPAGEAIRGVLLDKNELNLSAKTELLLFLASRSAWIKDVVEPAINGGKSVIADRSYPSTFAYQGYAGGMSLSTIKQMNDVVMEGRKPDLVIIVDISQDTMNQRMKSRNEGTDRIESKGSKFHAKVLEGYRKFARDNTDGNVVLIDGEGSIGKVHLSIVTQLNQLDPSLEIKTVI